MVTYSSLLSDLFADWKDVLQLCKRQSEPGKDWVENDEVLCSVLKQVIETRCNNIAALNVNEIVAFLYVTYPLKHLYELGGNHSSFLQALQQIWRPTMTTWVETLWRLCGKACNLFGMVFTANRMLEEVNDAEVGSVIFKELPLMRFVAPGDIEATMQSVLGAMLINIQENSYARFHETGLYEITKQMSPEETGFVVRQLFLFKSRPHDCQCGWLPMEHSCKCPKKTDFDPLKEYAVVLFGLVCKRRKGDFDSFASPEDKKHAHLYNSWTEADALKFVAVASENFFSESTYREICNNLEGRIDDECEPPPLKKARVMSDKENQANFQSSFAQHKGCIHVSCKQKAKPDCLNVSCKTHCHNSGYLFCRPHKKFHGVADPKNDKTCPIDYQQLLSKEMQQLQSPKH